MHRARVAFAGMGSVLEHNDSSDWREAGVELDSRGDKAVRPVCHGYKLMQSLNRTTTHIHRFGSGSFGDGTAKGPIVILTSS
jgi:hypothetical protein